MSAKQGARLWYEKARDRWCIVDNGKKQRTDCRREQLAEAEKLLEAHIVAKRSAQAPIKGQRLEHIEAATVISFGIDKRGATVARPGEYAQRASANLAAFGDLTMDEVDADVMESLADDLGPAYARRCLEDFRAAWNAYAARYQVREQIVWTLPAKSQPRGDYLTIREAIALARVIVHERDTQLRETRTGLREVTTSRARWSHLLPFLVVGIGTCTRSSRIYRASYAAEPGRPWIDLDAGVYHRAATGERVARNKVAPTVPLSPRLVRWLQRRATDRVVCGKPKRAERYLVEYAGRPVDCREAFAAAVAKARTVYPKLFRHPDGTPKVIVRHTLRHTGVSWMAQAGVPALEICRYAGMSMEVYSRVYAHAADTHAGVLAHQAKRSKPKVRKLEREDA